MTFRPASRRDFALPALVLGALILLAALLSSQPAVLTLPGTILGIAVWLVFVLEFSNVNTVESNLTMYPDGYLSIKSGRTSDRMLKTEAYLEGQQWCSRHVVVLRFVSAGKYQRMVLLSAQQNASDYRRLSVWLRQGVRKEHASQRV